MIQSHLKKSSGCCYFCCPKISQHSYYYQTFLTFIFIPLVCQSPQYQNILPSDIVIRFLLILLFLYCFSSCGFDAHRSIYPSPSQWGAELWSPAKQAVLRACSNGHPSVHWNPCRFPHHRKYSPQQWFITMAYCQP